MYSMYLKQPGFEAAVIKTLGRSVRITIKIGETAAVPMAAKPSAPAANEATERAMENPEVRRFQEMFPDSQVRTVRNLRDN